MISGADIDRIFAALDSGVCVSELIAEDERAAGREVIRPGDAPWLPAEDWEPGTVCSVDGARVNLILLDAKQQGRGAFTRLVAALLADGKSPRVIAPTLEFQATLKRRGWRRRGDAWRAPRGDRSKDFSA